MRDWLQRDGLRDPLGTSLTNLDDEQHAGHPPTTEAVINGSYPIARPLYFYTPGEPPGPTKDFLAWVLGRDGQNIVREVGFVPLPTTAVR